MENQKLLSKENLKVIKDRIQLELLKRCFTAPIVKMEEVISRGAHKISFETSEFQTVPVIFKSLKITNFGTSVEKKPKSELNQGATGEYISVWISVYCFFEIFDGGSNTTNLFAIQFNVFGSDYDDVKMKLIR
jgi:hypothetical protein